MDRPSPDLDQRAGRLLARDYLYDHPESFRAGVLAALTMIKEHEPARQPAAESHRNAGDRARRGA